MDFLDFLNVWPHVKIDWVKNSKFRLLTFFCRFIQHIFPKFDDNRTKTLGGVRENAQNMLILTIRLTPVTLTLVGRPRPYCPDARLLNTNISCEFRGNQMMGKGQKGCYRQTDGRPDKTIPISAKWQIKITRFGFFLF